MQKIADEQIQVELDRLHSALSVDDNLPVFCRLEAATQALLWVLGRGGAIPPYDMIMGTQEGSVDCSDECRPPQSLSTYVHCEKQQ